MDKKSDRFWTRPLQGKWGWFGWVAVLATPIFLATVAAGLLTEIAATSGTLWFVALGFVGVAAVMVSLVVFIRWLCCWRNFRRFLFGLACFATLIALFYAEENWRGKRAWTQFRRAGEAQGERFDLAEIVPPPVPDDQNFFETPLWEGMHFTRTNDHTVWRDTNWSSRVQFDVHGPKWKAAPRDFGFAGTERLDLAAWQTFYRGSNNLFTARTGGSNNAVSFTNYFPIAPNAQAPALDVLSALSKFDEKRRLLLDAARRPQARFWVNYEDGFAALLPHLANMKKIVSYLSLHAVASLKAGDNQTALEDFKLSLRLIEAIRSEPILITHFVREGMMRISLQPVWEGLADGQWTDAELTEIETELGRLDFLVDFHFAMRGERAFDLWAVDYMHRRGSQGLKELGVLNGNADTFSTGVLLKKLLGSILVDLMPSGWFDRYKLSLARSHANYVLPLINVEHRLVPPGAASQAKAAISRLLHPTPHDLLSAMLIPAVIESAEKTAQVQTVIDLARVACVLERYRRQHGEFPETLTPLVPQFIPKLPHDIINGQPLNYRRTDDGSFILYSVGWNEKDDGGTIAFRKDGEGVNWKDGDWVWKYPAK